MMKATRQNSPGARRRTKRRRSSRISKTRWVSYAAAGTATIAAGHHTAEAVIVHTDPADIVLDAASTSVDLNLDGVTDFIPWHSIYTGTNGGWAAVSVSSSLNRVAGYATTGGFLYAANLPAGVNVSTQPNISPAGASTYANLFYISGTYPNSEFGPGSVTGFLGLSFQAGADTLYGWMRVTVDVAPRNVLTIHDWAYNDDGGPIAAGQIPEPGSLGLLAMGGAGLLAWRRRRMQSSAEEAAKMA